MRRAIGRRVMVPTAMWLAACAGDPPLPETAAPFDPCVREQAPLVLADGTELYVEPQALLRVGDEWVLVGSPSYQFRVAPGREAVSLTLEAHVAAVLGDPARAIAKPLPDARIGSAISTSLGDGRWAAVFDEIQSDTTRPHAAPLSFWYGEHDGTRWTLVEPLPTPPGAHFDLRQSSSLVRTTDGLVWLSFENMQMGQRVHRYDRRDGVWRYEQLPEQRVERVGLGYDPDSGVWMAIAGEDEGMPRLERTIRLYRWAAERELVTRVDTLSSGSIVYDVFVDASAGTATVSWLVSEVSGLHAFARTGIRPGSAGTLFALDDAALTLRTLRMPDGSLGWITEHLDSRTRSRALWLLRQRGADVVRATTVPSPFTGFFSAVPNGPDEVLVVGAEMGLVPTATPVRSLILRLSTSC